MSSLSGKEPWTKYKKAPSGAYRTDLAKAAVAQLKAQGIDVYGKKWKKAKVTLTELKRARCEEEVRSESWNPRDGVDSY